MILKGTGKTYDSIVTGYKKEKFAFSILESDFYEKTGTEFTAQDYISFGLATSEGYLTNAGVLLADPNNYRHSRIFCTKWNGLDKTSEQEVIDDKEFNGSLIRQLKLALDFLKFIQTLDGIRRGMALFTNQIIAMRPYWKLWSTL